MVIDYRGINAITVRNRSPLPIVSHMLDQLAGAKVFSVLDMLFGFWQLPLRASHQERTAMQTPLGSYEWTVLPMGLTNSPPHLSTVDGKHVGPPSLCQDLYR